MHGYRFSSDKSFSDYSLYCSYVLSHVWLFVTPWTAALQAPLSMEFSRQEYWSGLPCPPPGDLPNPGIELRSPALQEDSLPSEPPGKLSKQLQIYNTYCTLLPMTYQFYNCKFLPFDPLYPFHWPPNPHLWQQPSVFRIYKLGFLSFFLFLDSTFKWDHTVFGNSQVALVVKNPPANARNTRDTGSISRSQRSPQ